MPAIMDIAKRHNLLVLEDSAQGHGASIESQKAGNWGHASGFSFYPSKKVLISNHVFVKLSKNDEFKVFESFGVLGYLNIHGERAKVWPKEINNLKNYCNQQYQQDNLSVGKTLKTPVLGSYAKVVRVDKNNMCSAISNCGRYTIKFKLAS